jgi:hypothetical protein
MSYATLGALPILIMLSLIAPRSSAQALVKDGGHGIVCARADGRIVSIDIWDYPVKGVLLGRHDLSIDDRVRIALARIPSYDADRRRRLEAGLASFWGRVEWSDLPLDDTNDSPRAAEGRYVDADGIVVCRQAILAYQAHDFAAGTTTFHVDRALWSAMGDDSRVGLVLHELIFAERVRFGDVPLSAERVEDFNQMLAYDEVRTLSEDAYREFLRTAGFTPR